MSPPLFTQHTTIGVNAPVWTPHSGVWPRCNVSTTADGYWQGSVVRPTTAKGHYYRMKAYPAWSADTLISPNQIITTGDSNGNLFFAYVPIWTPNTAVFLGQHMQPSPPDGKVYKVKHINDDARPDLGVTGPTPWSQPPTTDGTVVWELDPLKTGSFEPPGMSGMEAGWDTRPGGVTYDNNIEWYVFVPTTGDVEPNWNTAPGSETVDTPNAQVRVTGNTVSVDDGFGVVWVESGLDPADSKVADNDCEWTRIDTVPSTANVMPVGPANALPMRLTLNRLSLTNVDDTAGRWQFEGGEVFRDSVHIANYASTKRIVIKGTEAQNTAMLTLTLFFIGQAQQPPENVTLQGAHDFSSGDEIGSVSAASTAFASYIGKQFKRSGNALVIQ